MLFFLTFNASVNSEIRCMEVFTKKYEATQLFSKLKIIWNIAWAANQDIRVISEGSCDPEDWSNDAEHSALITGINYTALYIFK